MKSPSGNTLLQFQIGLLLALALVWWFTRPPETPVQINVFGPSPQPVPDGGKKEFRQRRSLPEPAWMSSIDTSKPKCAELKEELLAKLARGESMNMVYLGDCQKRMTVYQIVE